MHMVPDIGGHEVLKRRKIIQHQHIMLYLHLIEQYTSTEMLKLDFSELISFVKVRIQYYLSVL